MSSASSPSIQAIRDNRRILADQVLTTPLRRLRDEAIDQAIGATTQLWLKEELFQHTGSFKPRGALTVMRSLSPAALARGVTGVSAGNHAISLGYCARILGTHAKVVMPRTASPFRIQRCHELGVEVVLVDTVAEAFERVREIESQEGRSFVHPFEGPLTVLGTATVGLELIEQAQSQAVDLDAVIVAVGGGGLSAGIACAVRQLSPRTAVWAVEPEGADSLARSWQAGSPQAIPAVRTIADSLGAPRCEAHTYALNREYLEGVVLVSDDQIRSALRLLFRSAKLAVEPAGAAALAGLMFPLRERLAGQRVAVVVCGANIDAANFARYLVDPMS